MKRTGIVELSLVRGHVPHYREMVELGKAILKVICEEMGTKKLVERFSDPFWFSCLSCTMGFEWWTSGQTTVVMKALKDGLSREDIGVKVVGGKGKEGRQTKGEIIHISDNLGLHENDVKLLQRASVLSSKVDSTALQDDHSVYFHSLIVDEKGNFTIINQGMCVEDKTARRYHWLINARELIEEPHNAIVSQREKNFVLDLTHRSSRKCRESILDIVNDNKPERVQKMLLTIKKSQKQKSLLEFMGMKELKVVKIPEFLKVPKRINLNALRIAHGKVSEFEELLSVKGMGPATIRALAYISNLIYGTETSWKDPVDYSWAHGTKSGKPYYVNKELMEVNADILEQAVEEARLGKSQKLRAIKRLKNFLYS